MRIRRSAIRVLAFVSLVLVTRLAVAQFQVPANSNLDYQSPSPMYEHSSAPYSDSRPGPFWNFLPFGPRDVEPRLEIFGPAETSGYGNGPRPHIGTFLSYERLYWSLGKPGWAPVGSLTAPPPDFNTTPNGPTVDNSFIGATGAWGNRWEVGYIDDNNYGWFASVIDHVSQGQWRMAHDPQIRFDDPAGILVGFIPVALPNNQGTILLAGELPTAFRTLAMKNVLVLNGVELTRFYRAPRKHAGGFMEVLYGARWFQINDTYVAEGLGNGLVPERGTVSLGGPATTFQFPLNILDESRWSNRVLNNLVGPQVGLRWFSQRERWIVSVEARFLAAANFQNTHIKTELGTRTLINQAGINSNLTTDFRGVGSDTHLFRTTFSPLGELRVNTAYQLTSNFALKFGYTGMYVGNISRASNTIDFSGPNLISILNGGFHQTFFLNGLSFGVEFNR